jgi:hypothetical protein
MENTFALATEEPLALDGNAAMKSPRRVSSRFRTRQNYAQNYLNYMKHYFFFGECNGWTELLDIYCFCGLLPLVSVLILGCQFCFIFGVIFIQLEGKTSGEVLNEVQKEWDAEYAKALKEMRNRPVSSASVMVSYGFNLIIYRFGNVIDSIIPNA